MATSQTRRPAPLRRQDPRPLTPPSCAEATPTRGRRKQNASLPPRPSLQARDRKHSLPPPFANAERQYAPWPIGQARHTNACSHGPYRNLFRGPYIDFLIKNRNFSTAPGDFANRTPYYSSPSDNVSRPASGAQDPRLHQGRIPGEDWLCAGDEGDGRHEPDNGIQKSASSRSRSLRSHAPAVCEPSEPRYAGRKPFPSPGDHPQNNPILVQFPPEFLSS